MDFYIDINDLEIISQFIISGQLVQVMNEYGLSVPQMAFVLQSLTNTVSEVSNILEGEEE